MLPKNEKERIRKSDKETLNVRKEHLESVIHMLEKRGAYSYKGYYLFDVQKELEYIKDVLAFDFTPKRNL